MSDWSVQFRRGLLALLVLEIVVVVGLVVAMAKAPPTYKPVLPPGVKEIPAMAARKAVLPITVDGKLDEAVWESAPAYPLSLSKDEAKGAKQLAEGGAIKLAWNKQFLYVGIKFYDSDIVAQGTKDNEHHYKLGDTCELFLRPGKSPHYWEMYATPKGLKSTFWFWMRGGELIVDEKSELKVAAQIVENPPAEKAEQPAATAAGAPQNLGQDAPATAGAKPAGPKKYWTAELAVPVAMLTQYGDEFGPESDWRILVARYNYDQPITENAPKEHSSAPQLSVTSFHRHEDYAAIKFEQ